MVSNLLVITQIRRENQLTKGLKSLSEQEVSLVKVPESCTWQRHVGFLGCVFPSVNSKQKKVNKTRRGRSGSTGVVTGLLLDALTSPLALMETGNERSLLHGCSAGCFAGCSAGCCRTQERMRVNSLNSFHTKCLFHFMLPRKVFN